MGNENNALHEQIFRLHSYEVDQRGLARPDILLSFMLDSAWAHTKDTEFSYTELKDEGQLWVLSRFLAVFHDLPKWDDEIIVETWGKGTDKLFGLRDFIIHSSSGKKLISATSAWLIIDRKTSRIQRIETLGRDFPMQLQKSELDVKLEKIEPQSAGKTDFSHRVMASDLDVNRHVNSSRYLQWIIDSFPIEYSTERGLRSLEINFLSEAKLGEEIFTTRLETDNGFYCEVRKAGDNPELCRSIVAWNE